MKNDRTINNPITKENFLNNNSLKHKKIFTLLLFGFAFLLLTNIAFADLYLNSQTGNIILNTSSTERIRITSGGLLSIGTTTPDNLLTILGNELVSTPLSVLHINLSDNFNNTVMNAITLDHILKSAVNSTGGIGISILFRATDNVSQLSNIANISAILYNATNGSQLSALTFSTRGPDTGDGSFGHLIERLRIDGQGRIGIGTSAPVTELEIRGGVNISGGLNVTDGNVLLAVTGGLVGIGTDTPNSKLEVNGTLTVGGDIDIPLSNLNVGGGYTAGGITLLGSGDDRGSGQFGKDILLDGDVISVFDIEINQSFIPKLDLFSILGNISQRWDELFVRRIQAGDTSIEIDSNVTIYGNLSVSAINATGDLTLDSIGGNVIIPSGNVGIGTSSPAERLVVIGNVNISGTLNVSGRVSFPNLQGCDTIDTDVNGVLVCGTDAGGSSEVVNSTAFNRTGTNVILANTDDNVGIGTDTPDEKLHVLSTIEVGDHTVADGAIISDGSLYLTIDANDGSTDKALIIDADSTTTGSGTELMRITEAGNVGIGTTSPAQTLTVQGRVNISQNLTVNNSVLFVDGTAGQVIVSSGTSTVPSLVLKDVNGNVDNGFYSSGPDEISLALGGGQEVRFLTTTTVLKNNLNVGFGTADIPSLSFDGDADTGIYRSAINELTIVTFGSPRVVIDPSGNVGIGTTIPNATLFVQGNTTIVGNLNVTGVSYLGDLIINADNITVNNILSKDGNISFFNDSGNELMRITSLGRVGIGTSNPQQALDIAGNLNFTGAATITATGGLTLRPTGDVTIAGATNLQMGGNVINSAGGAIDRVLTIFGATNADLEISTNRDLTDSTEGDIILRTLDSGANSRVTVVQIDSNGANPSVYLVPTGTGNVGIGITTPQTPLHVNTTTVNGVARFESGDADVNIQLADPSTDGSFFPGLYATGDVIEVRGGSSSQGTGLAVDASGNVGIGTTSPYNTLTVVGDISASGSINATSINTTGGAYFATSSGNVGIGTTSPRTTLDVIGNVSINGSINVSGGNFVQTITSDSLREVGFIQDMNRGGSANVLDAPRSVYISGKYAYVTSDNNDSLTIIDISDPTNPLEVGNITDSGKGGTATALDGAWDVHVSGKYAYVTSFNDDSLTIIDVSDPSSPEEIGYVLDTESPESGGNATILDGPRGLYVSGKYAYVTSSNDDGLSIIDVSDPTNPTEVGFVMDTESPESGGTATVLDTAFDVYVSGKYAYVTSNSDRGLSVIDVSDPTNPTEVAFIQDTESGGSATVLDGAQGVYVSGKYAYVVSSLDDGLSIINISNLANVTEVGFIQDTESGGTATALDGATYVHVSGKYAYVTSENDDGLSVIDVSDPTSPVEVGYILGTESAESGGIATVLNNPYGLYVSGKYAYVVSISNDGLSIIDLGGIDSPVANIGNIESSYISVTENVDVGNNLYVRNGLNVGPGGILSDGPVSFFNKSLVIDSSGNVGIGTSSPAEKLVVIGNVNISDSLNVTNTVQLTTLSFADGTTQTTAAGTATNDSLWNQSGSNIFPNDISVNVGIGTTNPGMKLVVAGNVNVSQNLTVNNSVLFVDGTSGRVGIGTSSPGAPLHISYADSGFNQGLIVQNTETGGGDQGTSIELKAENTISINFTSPNTLEIPAKIVTSAAVEGRALELHTNDTARLHINPDGNVGIGTTNPGSLLTVASSSNPVVNISSGNGGATPQTNAQLLIEDSGDTAIQLVHGTGQDSRIIFGDSVDVDTGQIIFSGSSASSPNRMSFTTIGSTGKVQMVLTNNGNFGINSTKPSETLTVNGTMNIRPKGTSALFVDSDGNVGIGTTSPAQLLTVQGTLNVTADGTAVPNLFVASDGSVGIGDSTPSGNLQIQKSGLGNAAVVVISGESITQDESIGIIRFYNIRPGGNNASIRGVIGNGGYGNQDIAFFVGDQSTEVEVMRLDGNNQNVGIGTTSPGELLELGTTNPLLRFNDTDNPNWWNIGAVGDDFKIYLNDSSSDGITIDQDGNVGIGSASPAEKLVIADGFLHFDTDQRGISSPASTSFYLRPNGAGSTLGQVRFLFDGRQIFSDASGSAHVTFNNGNVGIETGFPSERLVVMGNLSVNASDGTSTTLFVDSTNNRVGIGTTSPRTTLDVIGNVSINGSINVSGGGFVQTITSNSLKEVGFILDTRSGGTATGLGAPRSVYVSGKYAYVASQNNDSLTIIDISNPANPTEVGVIKDDNKGGTATALDGAQNVYVSGKYAYVTSLSDNGLSIIDISNSSSPKEVGFIQDTESGGTATVLDAARGVYVSGRYAYVTSQADDGLSIIDISDPANPTEVGYIIDTESPESGGNATALDGANAVYVSGKYAYVIGTFDDGLTIIDISDPTSPKEVGNVRDTESPESGGTATVLDAPIGVYVSGRYAYVTSQADDGISIIDISNVTGPVEVSTVTGLGNTQYVHVSGRYAYVTSQADSLTVIDISDPTNPREVGVIKDTESGGSATVFDIPEGIYISGKYAYVTSQSDDGLSIILILSDPEVLNVNMSSAIVPILVSASTSNINEPPSRSKVP